MASTLALWAALILIVEVSIRERSVFTLSTFEKQLYGTSSTGGLWLCAHFTGATGSRPASEEGKPELTTAPWS
ncbi:MAG TPA: hypothetical protein VF205_02590 [Nitrospiraceae bacterium]